MRRAPNAGTNRELAVMAVLADEGWLCGSRRHIGGAGDILAVNNRTGWPEVYLIEVKSTAGGPWERFSPQDRQAMVETAAAAGAEAWLYHWPARGKLRRIPSSEWPKAHPRLEDAA
jgi:Holliday junction resolvase